MGEPLETARDAWLRKKPRGKAAIDYGLHMMCAT